MSQFSPPKDDASPASTLNQEDPTSASADTDAQQRTLPMDDSHSPRLLVKPLQLQSALQLSNQAKGGSPGTADALAIDALAHALSVSIDLDQVTLNRLFELWNTLLAVEADEVGDWSIPATAHIGHSLIQPAPALLSIGATVFASGEVSFAAMVEGVDVPLWFADLVDLHDLEYLPRDSHFNHAQQPGAKS